MKSHSAIYSCFCDMRLCTRMRCMEAYKVALDQRVLALNEVYFFTRELDCQCQSRVILTCPNLHHPTYPAKQPPLSTFPNSKMDNRQRGSFRSRGGPGGSGRGGSRGGGNQGSYNRDQQERKPREAILDLAKFMDKSITVKFNGGREGTFICTLFFFRKCPVS